MSEKSLTFKNGYAKKKHGTCLYFNFKGNEEECFYCEWKDKIVKKSMYDRGCENWHPSGGYEND